MKRNLKIEKKFIIFLSLCALFFISYNIIPTYARYITSIYNHGSIGVAKWNVSIAGEDDKELQTMYIGDSSSYQNYNLTVTSNSEIAVKYSVIISNVPKGVKIQVDDVAEPFSETNGTIKIQNLDGFSFSAGQNNVTHNHTLTILVPSESVKEAFDKQRLTIDVIFTQAKI